ncbi:flavin reductase family protein [Longimicrobium sp.]|uniref:flavin reductase family protein n=1 Tax=Longimicrobium sp. TaxID=2029185 RepID=UPI002E359611|nr:flavin reductase family protein [Longimicrobium sp.]HEX6042243.1 flavin reductase family protein [Longimicrobium sp.]
MARPIQASIRMGGADEPSGGVTAAAYREAMAHWASGVAVVAAGQGGDVEAVTATAFTPVSADPPLVLACLGNDAAVLYVVEEEGRFTVNLLGEDDRRTASAYAQKMALEPSPFPAEGDPVLAGALVSLVCRLRETHPGGDHRIVIGEVERVVLGAERDPLLYFARAYRRLGEG